MKFMKRIYEALGYEPPDDSSSIGKLEQIEDILGQPLPPAVKEWYAKEKAVEIMASRTCDRPVPLCELGNIVADWNHDGPRDFLVPGSSLCDDRESRCMQLGCRPCRQR